jgi:uncharacterized membrane protein YecN with MAPEG domain
MDKIVVIICLALFEYIFFAMKVGFSRNKHGVKAPAMSGNLEWERLNRIHQNTLEVYLIFIPSIIGFAYYVSINWACILGSIVLVARVLFYLGYKNSAKKRMLGVFMTSIPNYTLLVGMFIGALRKAFDFIP